MCPEELAQVELDWEDGARQINECECLFIDSIRELEELTLDLVVIESRGKQHFHAEMLYTGRIGSGFVRSCMNP